MENKVFNSAKEFIEVFKEICVVAGEDMEDDEYSDLNSGGNFEELLYATEAACLLEWNTENHEGGEDCGSYYATIYEVKIKGYEPVLVRYEGYYSSWDGVDWSYYNNPELVKKVTEMKPVTTYKPI